MLSAVWATFFDPFSNTFTHYWLNMFKCFEESEMCGLNVFENTIIWHYFLAVLSAQWRHQLTVAWCGHKYGVYSVWSWLGKSHLLNQYWLIENWNLWSELQRNLIQNTNISFRKMHLKCRLRSCDHFLLPPAAVCLNIIIASWPTLAMLWRHMAT